MVSRSDGHTSENHTIAGDASTYEAIIKIDADCRCVKVYKVYMVWKTYLIEEFGPVRKGFPKRMTAKPKYGQG